MPPPTGSSPEVLDALDSVVLTLEEACAEGEQAAAQARQIRDASGEGQSWQQLLAGGDEAPLVRQIASVLKRLGDSSSRLRRAEARALHGEGLSNERIAELFGVSRQRVSALLNSGRAE